MRMIKDNNVNQVINSELCAGCGCCSGVCPVEAITMKIDFHGNVTAIVDPVKCCNCGLCLKVCPGIEFCYEYFMKKIHGKLPENTTIGPVIETYAGYTKDKDILSTAQSGGIASAIMIFGIENKLFDGAIVTGYGDEDPFHPIIYIAKSREEVLRAAGSKYCSVPVGEVIRLLSKSEGKYAFVGTPCQIHGMRKAEDMIPDLKDKIALYLGLHCIGVYNNFYIDYLLDIVKKDRSSMYQFKYKEKMENENAPASTVVLRSKQGKEFKLPGGLYRLSQKPYFTNWRCQMCFDKLNEFSDISCGDCRISPLYQIQEKEGIRTSLSDILIRTERGREVFEHLVIGKMLDVRKSEVQDVIKTAKVAEKKLGVKYAKRINRTLSGQAPEYGIDFILDRKSLETGFRGFFSLLSMAYYRLGYHLIKFVWFRRILVRIPPKVLYFTNLIRDVLTVEYKYKDGCSIKIKMNQR